MIYINDLLYKAELVIRSPFEVPKNIPSKSVVLASFPKSGNSWLRFILSNINIITLNNDNYTKANFHNINKFCPVIRGNRNLKGHIQIEDMPLFLKTHFPFNRFFSQIPSVVIVRNPKFVIPSYYEYLANAHNKKLASLSDFNRSWRHGLSAWINFYESWLKSDNAIIIRYEDLKINTPLVIKGLYQSLGYDIPEDIIKKAIELSDRDNMKKILNDEGDPYSNNNFNFVKPENFNTGMDEIILNNGFFRQKRLTMLLNKFDYE